MYRRRNYIIMKIKHTLHNQINDLAIGTWVQVYLSSST